MKCHYAWIFILTNDKILNGVFGSEEMALFCFIFVHNSEFEFEYISQTFEIQLHKILQWLCSSTSHATPPLPPSIKFGPSQPLNDSGILGPIFSLQSCHIIEGHSCYANKMNIGKLAITPRGLFKIFYVLAYLCVFMNNEMKFLWIT